MLYDASFADCLFILNIFESLSHDCDMSHTRRTLFFAAEAASSRFVTSRARFLIVNTFACLLHDSVTFYESALSYHLYRFAAISRQGRAECCPQRPPLLRCCVITPRAYRCHFIMRMTIDADTPRDIYAPSKMRHACAPSWRRFHGFCAAVIPACLRAIRALCAAVFCECRFSR